jgi:hypothetical protein
VISDRGSPRSWHEPPTLSPYDRVGIRPESAYDDEVLFCEGDLPSKTEAELRSLHFRRDRDYLRPDPD